MQLEVGTVVEGKVTGITKFGAFVEVAEGKTGMVHISEIASEYVTEIRDHVSENQAVKVKILNVTDDGKISLSIKKALPPAPKKERKPYNKPYNNVNRGPARPANIEWTPRNNAPASFEDMMSKFKQNSEDKQSDLKRAMKDSGRRGSRKGGGFNG